MDGLNCQIEIESDLSALPVGLNSYSYHPIFLCSHA